MAIPVKGDRSAFDDINYPTRHAADLEAGLPTHHLPADANEGESPVWRTNHWEAEVISGVTGSGSASGSPSGSGSPSSSVSNSAAAGGDVFGNASVTDGHLAVFDGDGYHIKDGGVVPIGGGGLLDSIFPLTTPVSGNFAWVNQVDATVTTVGNKMILYDPSDEHLDFHLFLKDLLSVPYIVTIGFIPNIGFGDWAAAGMVLYESSSGKFIHFSIQYRSDVGGPTISLCSMTDVNTWSEDYLADRPMPGTFGPMLWLQIEDDGFDIYYRLSFDGYIFRDIYTHVHGTFITPDRVGFGLASYESAQAVWSTILHYSELGGSASASESPSSSESPSESPSVSYSEEP